MQDRKPTASPGPALHLPPTTSESYRAFDRHHWRPVLATSSIGRGTSTCDVPEPELSACGIDVVALGVADGHLQPAALQPSFEAGELAVVDPLW